MKATIRDVSQLSGVSTATVSRVFSDPERVRPSTREKVLRASDVLGYAPNAIARAMATQRTGRVGYIICKKRATLLDEFYAGICEGIMRRANKLDLELTVSTVTDWMSLSASARSKQVEGVILGGDAPAELVGEFHERGVPVVLVNNVIPGLDLPTVLSDEREGVRQAVEHLVALGHRRIGMVIGSFSQYIISQRYDAFAETLKGASLSVSPKYVAMCGRDAQSAAEATAPMLAPGEERPTALLASNDVIACGILKAAARAGLKVPDQLAVVGIDDSSICTLLEPELSSVRVDVRSMGETSMDLLKALMDADAACPRRVVIPSALIVRASSAGR